MAKHGPNCHCPYPEITPAINCRKRVIRPAVDIVIPVPADVQAEYEAALIGKRGRKPKPPEPTYVSYPELEILMYAPGDGDLSFTAVTLDTRIAVGLSPTREECEQLLKPGWELYENGPYFRARKAKTVDEWNDGNHPSEF